MAGRIALLPMQIGEESVLVEVTASAGGSENTSSRLDRAQQSVAEAFERAQGTILAIGQSTVATIGALSRSAANPAEVEVKFGLKFTVEGSVVVAGAAGEATLEVAIRYKPPQT